MIYELMRSTLVMGMVIVTALPMSMAGWLNRTATVVPAAVQVTPVQPRTPAEKLRRVRGGRATWYGNLFNRHRTASGEIFDARDMTGASNTLPFGTRVRVTNLRNHQSVVVRINDRGLLSPGIVIDLSSGAAGKIGLLKMGIAPVSLDVITAI